MRREKKSPSNFFFCKSTVATRTKSGEVIAVNEDNMITHNTKSHLATIGLKHFAFLNQFVTMTNGLLCDFISDFVSHNRNAPSFSLLSLFLPQQIANTWSIKWSRSRGDRYILKSVFGTVYCEFKKNEGVSINWKSTEETEGENEGFDHFTDGSMRLPFSIDWKHINCWVWDEKRRKSDLIETFEQVIFLHLTNLNW